MADVDPVTKPGLFIGRQWLLRAVRKWTESDARYLFLTGPPGTGKSAAVDHLWRDAPVTGDIGLAVHRCHATDRRSCDPVRFAESIAEQFSSTLPGFTDALLQVSTEMSGRTGDIHIEGSASAETVHPLGTVIGVRIVIANVSADEAFDRLVARPLTRLAPQPLPVVVVDALDEALTYRGHRTIAELVLDGTEGLPVRFVIASRHDERVTAAQVRFSDAVSLDLVTEAPNVEADLAEYADHRLRGLVADDDERDRLAHRLARVGAGSYLYVHHLTAELIGGHRALADLDDPSALPGGLEELYDQFLRRELRPLGNSAADERWRREFRPVLSLLVVAQGQGFSSQQLAAMLDGTHETVQDTIRVLRQYLVGEVGGPWRLYHRSFAEYLLRGPNALLHAADGHQRIVGFAFGQWVEDWLACDDRYYIRHLPHHVMSALEGRAWTRSKIRQLRDRLYSLATSEPFLAAQRAADPDREPHLATLALALESSLVGAEYGRVTALGIALYGAQTDADGVTPVRAALDWGLDAGVAKARTYPEQLSLIWHLLILAALGLRDPQEAGAAATVIGRSGFGVVEDGWAPALALLLAPFLPAMDTKQVRAVLGVSNDFQLGYLAYFLLDWLRPSIAIWPALWIEEDLPRARATTEIVSTLAMNGEYAAIVPQLGEAVMHDYEQRRRQTERLLGHDPDESQEPPLRTYLLIPDVPGSVLVAEAARNQFESACEELTEKDSPWSFRTTGDAVLLGRVVDAVMNGGPAIERLRDAGEAELARDPGYSWNLLHYASYLRTTGDPRVPELLDRVVRQANAECDGIEEWERYEGHIDAFHGRCDVGLRIAVVRALCDEGRTTQAYREAEVLLSDNPTEYIRALSYVYQAETDESQAAAVLESARQAAGDERHQLVSQAMLVLLDGDFERLLTALSAKLARANGDTFRMRETTWSLLSWAAHVRGDHDRALEFGRRAVREFTAVPQDDRTARLRDRLIRNLLRAGLAAQAEAVSRLESSHWGARILLFPSDVQHSLMMSAEIEELHTLRRRLGQPEEPAAGRTAESQGVVIRYLRAVEDTGRLDEMLSVARADLQTAVAAMIELIREEDRYDRYDSYPQEVEAARLAVLAAEVGDPEAAENAVGLMRAWAHRADMASMSWDAFRGHFPRQAESMREYDNTARRVSQVHVYLAEAYHCAGNPELARASWADARQFAKSVQDSGSRALASLELAEVAARCGWYAQLQELQPELTRVRGSALGSVAEILVVSALRGDAGARTALDAMLLDRSLVNVDCADLLALLSVFSATTDVEEILIAAAAGQ